MMDRLTDFYDALLWSPVDTVDYDPEAYVEVLERNRLTGDYRTTRGHHHGGRD